MSFYIYQSAVRDEKEKNASFCIHVMVCGGGGGDFSVSFKRKSTRAIFFPQYYVHINVEFYIHACMCWRKKEKLDRADQ